MQTATQLELAFQEHYSEIVAFCRRRVESAHVDEIVGDVFAELWRKSSTVETDKTRAWLFGVARNKIANHHRSYRRRTAAEGRLVAGRVQHVHPDPAVSVTQRSVIVQAADMLSDTDRELLELISWEGLTPTELAVVLECTNAAVHVRVHRMRERLQSHLRTLELDTADPSQATATQSKRTSP